MNKKIKRKLISIKNGHKNLISVKTPIYSNLELGINGIFVQGIENDKGIIAEHNHFATKEIELIHIQEDSYYPGLKSKYISKVGNTYLIIPNIRNSYPNHGNSHEESFGEWISIKLDKNKLRYLQPINFNGYPITGIGHYFKTNNNKVMEIIISKTLKNVKNQTTELETLLELPKIEEIKANTLYQATQIKNHTNTQKLGRYVTINVQK